MKLGIEPLGPHIILKILPKEDKSEGGIILPEVRQEAYTKGKVMAVGQGYRGPDGKFGPLTVKVGDVVIYNRHTGTQINYKGIDYTILQEHEIWMREKN